MRPRPGAFLEPRDMKTLLPKRNAVVMLSTCLQFHSY